jgi:hypothetical protein
VGISFALGDISPTEAAPIALGVLLSSTIGARTLVRPSNMMIRGDALQLASVY